VSVLFHAAKKNRVPPVAGEGGGGKKTRVSVTEKNKAVLIRGKGGSKLFLIQGASSEERQKKKG